MTNEARCCLTDRDGLTKKGKGCDRARRHAGGGEPSDEIAAEGRTFGCTAGKQLFSRGLQRSQGGVCHLVDFLNFAPTLPQQGNGAPRAARRKKGLPKAAAASR